MYTGNKSTGKDVRNARTCSIRFKTKERFPISLQRRPTGGMESIAVGGGRDIPRKKLTVEASLLCVLPAVGPGAKAETDERRAATAM